MKPSRRFEYLATWGVLLAALGACSSITVAEKNLEEGRLVPEEAVATTDFLNEYHHPLSPPSRALASLDVALERKNVLARGGRILAQIGIATASPALKPVSLHALVFAPADPGPKELAQIDKALSAVRAQARELPTGGTFTVDTIQPIGKLAVTEPPFLPDGKDGDFKSFLRDFVRRSFDEGEHHCILIVGSYKGFLDLQGLDRRDRQDLVDLGRILEAKSVTLSVLSVGDKPDFAFLGKLSHTGRGTFNVATESLDYEAWIREDLRIRSAETLTEIELVATAGNGARLVRVLAPLRTPQTNQSVTYALPELKQGDQRVVLAELDIPARGQDATSEVLAVELKYYVPSARRYYKTRETVAIRYVDDPNLALPRSNRSIERSLLILESQKTLQSVAAEIRERRNYQAIALLTRQSRALRQTGTDMKDAELLRDAGILAKYADRLYDLDGEWFQAVKIWSDLNWDNNRFRDIYK